MQASHNAVHNSNDNHPCKLSDVAAELATHAKRDDRVDNELIIQKPVAENDQCR